MSRHVLLVVEHRRNEELLREWLDEQEAFDAVDNDERVDLVVADASALAHHRLRFEQLRERERPAYLPLLLVASPQHTARLPRDVWRLADEMLTTPVRRAELALRLERLLAVREQSLVTAKRIDELGRSNVDLEQFAYVAAHELAAPLAVVTGALETIAGRYRDRFDDAVKPLIDAAEHESERLQTLIQDLLAFSQAGRRAVAAPLPLADVVQDALGALKPQIEAFDAEIEIGDLPVVSVDPRQLRIVFTNLIGNAIKYRAPDRTPQVVIDCGDEGEFWRVCIEDNGRGVAAERMATIFEMFERGDTGRQVGHGIGLALCRRIVERHDGRIWVEAAAGGEGSRFCFTLPKR
jgi:signal transduction histidine kinase